MDQFDNNDYWKGVILYGLNQATYKIALGKTLIELTSLNKEVIDWSELSKSFYDNYIERFKNEHLPQQSNSSRITRVEKIYLQHKTGTIDYKKAIELIGLEAFGDVIPRFQTIGTNKSIIGERFYHFDFGNKLYLRDPLFKIVENDKLNLLSEIDTRWSLLEGAFKINQGDWTLSNDIREMYITSGYDRKPLSNNIPFLKGYQGNVCFYCGEQIEDSNINVDHVLPRQVVRHDEIWNLVLSHSLCNLHKDDFLIGKHYLEKLILRNENIMGSNHPWKKKISETLGVTKNERIKTTLKHYDDVRCMSSKKVDSLVVYSGVNISEMSSTVDKIIYSYTTSGQLNKRETFNIGNAQVQYKTEFTYDAIGQLLEEKNFEFFGGSLQATSRFTFSYNGTKRSQMNRYTNGVTVYSGKTIYTWTGDNITSIAEYNQSNVLECTTNFTYDITKENSFYSTFKSFYLQDLYDEDLTPIYFLSKNQLINKSSQCPTLETDSWSYTYNNQSLTKTVKITSNRTPSTTTNMWTFTYTCDFNVRTANIAFGNTT